MFASGSNRRPFFCMGLNTYEVPSDFHENNRKRLVNSLKGKNLVADDCTVLVYLEGGKSLTRNDSDHEPIFRQESYFHYLFGVKEPDFAGMINISSGETVLFMPRLPEEYATFMGKINSSEEVCALYGVDQCHYIDEVEEVLSHHLRDKGGSDLKYKASKLFLLEGTNSDSGNMYVAPNLSSSLDSLSNKTDLFPILAECRVIKSNQELALMRHVSELSSEAHVEVMRHCKPGMTEFWPYP